MAGIDSITELYRILLEAYGKQNWWPAETPFEVCVGAVLTQNTNWKNVEKAIENLKKENLLSPEKLVLCPDEKLENLIKPAGFFRQKSRYLKNLAEFILEKGGLENLIEREKEELRNALLGVKGIGKETADSILLYALNKPSFVVDAYTKRLFFRLGLINDEKQDYEFVKNLVEEKFPPEEENLEVYKEFHALIVEHAKGVCRKRPVCHECILCDRCMLQFRIVRHSGESS